MSRLDIFRQEVASRRLSVQNLELANIAIIAEIEEYSKLDESYKIEEKKFRDELECIYKETRHYNAKWPVVYSFAQTQKYPYFDGDSDDTCNPYYRISDPESALSPIFSPPTRTGGSGINRDRDYPNENARRTTALAALIAYPDTSGEISQGSCSLPEYLNEILCTDNGGIWSLDYPPGATGVEKLQNALIPWRSSLTELKVDLCNPPDISLTTLIQSVIDEIDNCLSLLPGIPEPPDNSALNFYCTNPFYTDQVSCELAGETWKSDLQISINTLIDYINTTLGPQLNTRKADFNAQTSIIEQKFFGIIGLRLHMVNGSYTKFKQLKSQLETHKKLIEDHKKSIANINVLIVSES